MASLRTLLGIVTESSLASASAPDAFSKLPPYPSPGRCVQYISALHGATCQGYDTSFDYYAYQAWCVPAGVSDVIFEIWGAGGGGGSSCCCGRAIPGGSGAYAVKRIRGTLSGTTSSIQGCCYSIDVAQPGNGRDGNTCGQQGGKTFITGFGLTNFCAEGGHGGCSCCYACCCTWYNIVQNGGTTRTGCLGGCCASYFGADSGAFGTPGAAYFWCYDNHCWNKQFIPYPAGLVNGKGGWLPANVCENSGCGYCLNHYAMTQLPWGGGFTENNYIPGVGGSSGWTCGGGCCYGQQGTPGLIRISFK